jgi:hypothetical protein
LPPTAVFWFKFSVLEFLSIDFYYSALSIFFLASQFIFLFTYFKLAKAALIDKSFFASLTEVRRRFSFHAVKFLRNHTFKRRFGSFTLLFGCGSLVLFLLATFFFEASTWASAEFIQFLSVLWNN